MSALTTKKRELYITPNSEHELQRLGVRTEAYKVIFCYIRMDVTEKKFV